MNNAPVIVFACNRPDHLRQSLNALKGNHLFSESKIFVFQDGCSDSMNKSDWSLTKKVVEDFCTENSNAESKISEVNKGLATSVTSGIDHVLASFDRVIVLEDDLITSPFFLTFMNDALNVYKDAENVYQVNGFMFPLNFARAESVLMPYISTWGWGTWKNKWKIFDFKMPMSDILISNLHMNNRFNLGRYDYVSMLNVSEKKSWGIRFYYHVFVRNGLSVFPTKSLVANIGMDGSGTNASMKIKDEIFDQKIPVTKSDMIDLRFLNAYYNYFDSLSAPRSVNPALWIKKIFIRK